MIPHKTFAFAKVWLLLAKFEVRHRDLSAARKVLGQVSERGQKGSAGVGVGVVVSHSLGARGVVGFGFRSCGGSVCRKRA